MSSYQQPNYNDIVRYVLGKDELDLKKEMWRAQQEKEEENENSINQLMDMMKRNQGGRLGEMVGKRRGAGVPMGSNFFGASPHAGSNVMPAPLKFASDFPSHSSPSDTYDMLGYVSRTFGISPDVLQQGIMQSGRLMKAPPLELTEQNQAGYTPYESASGWVPAAQKLMALILGGGSL